MQHEDGRRVAENVMKGKSNKSGGDDESETIFERSEIGRKRRKLS